MKRRHTHAHTERERERQTERERERERGRRATIVTKLGDACTRIDAIGLCARVDTG